MDSVLQYKHNFLFNIICSHNPCFSGQCFAIETGAKDFKEVFDVTILVLVDSVLQYRFLSEKEFKRMSQSLF